jgi:hypothetical protein
MRRLWLVLFAIVSVNSMLLSGCPIAPPPASTDHGGGDHGGSGSGGM